MSRKEENTVNALRSEKGKSLVTLPPSYTIIDVVTTGHDYHYDNIVEIAAIKVKNNNKYDYFSSLVKNSYVDNFITELTGITNEMVQNAPSPEIALKQFLDFIGDDILIAHAASFDINFLYDNSLRHLKTPLKNNFVDTLRISRKLLKLENHRLSTLIDYLGLEPRVTSRAESGCLYVFEIYNHLKGVAEQLEDYQSLWKKTKKKTFNIKDLKPETFEFDQNSPLYGKMCVFTGAMERLTRKDAMQIVLNIGGTVGATVTKKTNYLIIGNYDYCKTIKDGKSSKHKKAEQLKLSGQDIEIISESVFYDMIIDEV